MERNADRGAVSLLALETLDVDAPLAAVNLSDLSLLSLVVTAGDGNLLA